MLNDPPGMGSASLSTSLAATESGRPDQLIGAYKRAVLRGRELQRERDALRQRVAELETRCTGQAEDLGELQRLRDEVHELQDELQQARDATDAAQERAEQYAQLLQQRDATDEQKDAELSELQQQLAEAQSVDVASLSQVQALRHDLDAMRAAAERYEAEARDLRLGVLFERDELSQWSNNLQMLLRNMPQLQPSESPDTAFDKAKEFHAVIQRSRAHLGREEAASVSAVPRPNKDAAQALQQLNGATARGGGGGTSGSSGGATPHSLGDTSTPGTSRTRGNTMVGASHVDPTAEMVTEVPTAPGSTWFTLLLLDNLKTFMVQHLQLVEDYNAAVLRGINPQASERYRTYLASLTGAKPAAVGGTAPAKSVSSVAFWKRNA